MFHLVKSHKLFFWLVFASLILAQILIWHKIKLWGFLIGETNLWDLDIYWQMARDVLNGVHPYQLSYMQTSGPPLVIAPFIVFVGFNQAMARGLMSFLSVVATFATGWILSGQILATNKKNQNYSLVKLSLSLLIQLVLWVAFPTRFTLLLGQPNLILMWLISLILTTHSAQKLGVLAGILTVFKTNFAILLFSFFPKKLISLGLALGTILLIIILNFGWLKPSYYLDYMTQRAGGYITTPEVINQTDYYNQSLRASLNRLSLGQYFPYVWGLSLGLGAFWLIRTQDMESGILLSLILSPLTWSHYVVIVYPILILKFAVWLKHHSKISPAKWCWLALSFGLLVIELKFLHQSRLSLPTGIMASHYFIGLLILFKLRVWEISSQLSR